MDELSFAGSEPLRDFPERVGTGQLAEEHGDKLIPAGKSAGMAFGVHFFHGLLEFRSRKELQELTEYATKPIHCWPSFDCEIVSLREINLSQANERAHFF